MNGWIGLLDALRGRMKQLRAVMRRGAAERELSDELSHHVELETAANVRRGLSPVEARRAALVAFGGVERYAERVREVRWTRGVEELFQDARYAARGLWNSPGYALAAVLTLALGIGANAALYGVVDGLVNRMPAGVSGSDRLVRVGQGKVADQWSYPDFRDLAASVPASTIRLAAWQSTRVALGTAGESVRRGGQLVSAGYFDVLGVRPVRGRFFEASEDEVPGRDAVVVLGHDLWRRQYAGADDVVGSTIDVNGHPFVVVGVAPPGFAGLDFEAGAELWFPLMMQGRVMPRSWDVAGRRTSRQLTLLGRLGPGMEPAAATAALIHATSRLPVVEGFERAVPVADPLRGWIPAGWLKRIVPLLAFAGVLTLMVMLTCCANVAGLALSRAMGRSREVAVRLALGAGPGRIIRLLVTEALILSVAAGVAGVVVAFQLAGWFQHRFTQAIWHVELRPDADTLLFTFAAAAVAGLLFGLAPARQAAKQDVQSTLKGGGSRWAERGRLRGTLVAGQVALSLVLLVVTGLLLVRLRTMQRIDVGFDAAPVAAFSVDLHARGYDQDRRARFMDGLRRGLEAVPGVVAVAAPTHVPLGPGVALMAVAVTGVDASSAESHAATSPVDPPGETPARVAVGAVGVPDDFFRVLDVPISRGRAFTAGDLEEGAEAVVVISDVLARRLWPAADPIGRILLLGEATARVVGTVRALALGGLDSADPLQVYVPESRHFQMVEQHVMVRVAGDPRRLLPALRDEVRRVDPAVPVFDMHVLDDRIAAQLATQRSLTRVLAGFGVVALLLALVGVYGVVATNVAARRREIGIRVALGARAREVTALFVGRGARLALSGAVAGTLAALAVGRLVSSVFYGIRPLEPAVLLASPLALLAATLLASWLPARRAARVDPVETLRRD